MCEICHKNSDEVPGLEEIRPVIAAAPAMMEVLVEVIAVTKNLPVCPFCHAVKGVQKHRPDCLSHEVEAAIRKARGEDA